MPIFTAASEEAPLLLMVAGSLFFFSLMLSDIEGVQGIEARIVAQLDIYGGEGGDYDSI